MTKILAFLASIVEMWTLVKGVIGLYRRAKKEGWLNEGKEVTYAIGKAKTPEKRRDLAKSLAGHIRG
jgi:hypothetical protein